MAVTLQSLISLKVDAMRIQPLDKGALREPHTLEAILQWASGTSASQADTVWSDSRSVVAAAHDNLDLTALAQLDNAGSTVRTNAFAVIKAIAIKNTSSAGYMVLGGGTDGAAAADAWALTGAPFAADGSLIHLPFGGVFLWSDPVGVAVTNTSADILHLGAISATQTYDIIIIGET